MNNFIKQFWRTEQLGLQLYIKDARELFFDEIFEIETNYVPKFQSNTLAPIFSQDQKRRNNCSFNAWADVLGIYFGEQISVRYLTAKAYQQGLAKKNGSTTTRTGGKVAQKWGCVLESDCPSNEDLSDDEYIKVDFNKLDKLATERKIGSYYCIRKVSDYLQAIDNGYAVVIGRKWLYSMTQSGGFKFPWIIERKGVEIGGHSTSGIGYWTNYHNQYVSIESNSYGTSFGDKGNFYCPLLDLQKDIDKYGAYAITDIPYTPKEIKMSLIEKIIVLLKQLLALKVKTMKADEIVNKATSLLGTDFTDDNVVPDKVSCSFAVTTILHDLDPNIPIMPSTTVFWRWLQTSPKFERVYEPQAGDIVICATGTNTRPDLLPNGHVGIYKDNVNIMSNASSSGLWEVNYTRESWRKLFYYFGGYNVYLYRLK